MIGLDTNVLVRYLAQDDAAQAALATRLIENELTPAQPGFISLVVLAEVCWVLTSLYEAGKDELIETVGDFLNTPWFQIEKREVVQAAIRRFKAGSSRKAGFADALITEVANAEGCLVTMTFDKAAVRAAGMTLLV
ncbi:MAG: type II toxin-antitoxin system VapC family toxin [Pseudomonadota bacterium]